VIVDWLELDPKRHERLDWAAAGTLFVHVSCVGGVWVTFGELGVLAPAFALTFVRLAGDPREAIGAFVYLVRERGVHLAGGP
jgi:hypothetical protein